MHRTFTVVTLPLVVSTTVLVFHTDAVRAGEPGFRIRTHHSGKETSSPHLAAGVAFDSKRARMIIFGYVRGTADGEGGRLTTYDPQKDAFGTIETSGATPTGVAYPSLVYDPKRDALFLFGGWPKNGNEPTDELWTLHLGGGQRPAWRMLPQEKQSPRARNGGVMVLDVARDRLLLHGGDGGPHPKYGFTPLNDLWAYELTRDVWVRLEPKGPLPAPRWNHCAAIDNDSGKMFVFGGTGYTCEEQLVRDRDVFILDLERLEWTRRPCSGACPDPVQGATLTLDRQARALVLVGGLRTSDSGESGTTSVWVYDLATGLWFEHRGIDRKYRRAHTAVYDPSGRQHIVHGGETSWVRGNHYKRGQPLYDTMLLSLTRPE